MAIPAYQSLLSATYVNNNGSMASWGEKILDLITTGCAPSAPVAEPEIRFDFSSQIEKSQDEEPGVKYYFELGSGLSESCIGHLLTCIHKKWISPPPHSHYKGSSSRKEVVVRICNATDRRCALTYGYLKALCFGDTIVCSDWLQDSVHSGVNRMKSPLDYEILGSSSDYFYLLGSPSRSRNLLRNAEGRAALLSQYDFYFVARLNRKEIIYLDSDECLDPNLKPYDSDILRYESSDVLLTTKDMIFMMTLLGGSFQNCSSM